MCGGFSLAYLSSEVSGWLQLAVAVATGAFSFAVMFRMSSSNGFLLIFACIFIDVLKANTPRYLSRRKTTLTDSLVYGRRSRAL